MSAELRRQVLELYREVDQTVADADPVCLASGRCCHFTQFDHILFLSNLEAEILLENAPSVSEPVTRDRCPYQKQHLCSARERRPLACRVYYCDPAYQETAQHITEHYLARLKALAREHQVPWQYAPLPAFLEEIGLHCTPTHTHTKTDST